MKILYLSPVGFFKGGAERSLFDLISNDEITAILAAPEDGPVLDRGRELGLPCHVLDFGSINSIHRPFTFGKGVSAITDLIKAAKNLRDIARKEDIEIIHSNGLKAHMINCVTARLFGTKAIIHIRDIPYTKPEILVWKIMHALCHKMVLVSHACWPGDTLPRKAIVIHNGTPLIEGELAEKEKSDTITVGFAGRIHPAKGLHLLIDWVKHAKDSDVKLTLSVRGSYSSDAPDYEDEINTQIQKLGLEDEVHFTGFIDSAEKLYEGLDVVVVPSETPDPLPRSVMESMARGIPVLGYPAGGIFEMIDDGETGYLVKDSKGFVNALKDIQNDPERLKNMTKAAKTKIEREFSIPALHQNMTKIYRSFYEK